MNYWLVKQEPEAYSWETFVKDGGTAWTGVRNYQARNNLKAMDVGDHVLYYHSVTGKAVVGIAKVTRLAYPDPTTDDDRWICVDLAPVKPLPEPVSLDRIKEDAELHTIPLVKQSRLSVMPLEEKAYKRIVKLGGAK